MRLTCARTASPGTLATPACGMCRHGSPRGGWYRISCLWLGEEEG